MEKFPKLKEKVRMVIVGGGYGTRMWPMSRRSLPKQFQPLLGDLSFFQDTYKRLRLEFSAKDIFVSVPKDQAEFIPKQVKEIPAQNIIAEPERRDNFGAIGFATAVLDKRFPGCLMGVTWQDHFVRDKDQYARVFLQAARVAQVKNVICKIDSPPPYPAGQMGWVRIGKKIGRVGNYDIHQFLSFWEKPGDKEAKKLFRKKDYFINTGYYVWRTTTMLGFFEEFAPKTFVRLKKIQAALGKKNEAAVVAKEYHQIEKTSIDYGLYEKLPPESMLVLLEDIGWHDVGTWDTFYEALARGQKENVAKGEVYFDNCRGNLTVVNKKGKIAAVIGASGLIVVDTDDGLLVCKRGRSSDVKKFVNWLKEKGKKKYL